MTSISRPAASRRARTADEYGNVDLAIIAESTYPYLRGGVSAVIHDIARANPDRSVGIIHIAWDSNCATECAYEMPPNVRWVYPVYLSMNDHVDDFKLVSASAMPLTASERRELSAEVFAALDALAGGDTGPTWRLYDQVLNPRTRKYPLWPLLTTREFMTTAMDRFAEFGIPFTELFWLLREFFSLVCAIAGADYPKAKVYHSHTTGYAGLLAAIAARQNSGRVLLTEHNLYTRDTINSLLDRNMNTVVSAGDWRADGGPEPVQRAWMAWYIEIGRLIYQAADQITYLYPAAITEAEGLGSDAAKSEIVPNGMMLEKFEPARAHYLKRRAEAGQPAKQPTWRLAYCARLVPIKGLLDLISCVSELVQAQVTNFTLDVMGHADEIPDYAAECYRRASELGLDDYIRFRGNLNMAEVLGDFDMLILPSYNEGQPLVVMEAMAVGLPIISTPVGGMEQLILNSLDDGPEVPGPCGLLVPPGDVTALAAAVRSLIADQALYRFFSENSRTRISRYFELERAMGAYRVIYSQLEGGPAAEQPVIPAPRKAEQPLRLEGRGYRESSDVLLAAAVSAADHQLQVLSRAADQPPRPRDRPAAGSDRSRRGPGGAAARPSFRQGGDGGAIPPPRPAPTGPEPSRGGGGTVLRLGSRAVRSRLAVSGLAAAVAIGAFGLAAAQAGADRAARHASGHLATQDGGRGRAAPGSHRPGAAGWPVAGFPGAAGGSSPAGTLRRYWVGRAWFSFTEPARTGPSGQPLGARTLVTLVRYPAAGSPSQPRPRPAAGRFPLIVFAPGFGQCGYPYSHLLQAWASAGYVVAVVDFPGTDCRAGATMSDLVNQPGDVSYAITRLLAAGANPHSLLAGLIEPGEVAVAGQAEGGGTVAALAASGCCADRRVRAVAVLSGARWPGLPGRYFGGRTPAMLFVQGNADKINPPAASLRLYQADPAPARYYLDLLGAGHMTPYVGVNPVERLTALVTLAFFDRWVLGQVAADQAIRTAGTVPGVAALVSGGSLPPR